MKDPQKPLVSIIIPVIKINDYLRRETIPAVLRQNYQNFEMIIVSDRPTKEKSASWRTKVIILPSWPKTGPADKRDLGAAKARGEILAFLDDDSYPDKNWLAQGVKIFQESRNIAGVCGPTLTPPKTSFREKIGGYVWGSSLGSRAAGLYRYVVFPRRQVDDFPTANLLVRKNDFRAAAGFQTHFWSGEDTKLCLGLTRKLGKTIIYDPKVLAYHHRREVFRPHLIQIARYGLHRGHFARIMPQTSLRLGYALPSILVVGLLAGPILGALSSFWLAVYFLAILAYLGALLGTGGRIFIKEKSLKLFLLVMIAIFLTHVVYGIFFIKGFLTPKLKQ